MAALFRYGGLFLALILLVGPAFWLRAADEAERTQASLERFRLYGFTLGETLRDVQRRHADLQLSVTVGPDNRIAGFAGYLFDTEGGGERDWSAVLSFTSPAQGEIMYGVIVHHEDVTPEQARRAVASAGVQLGSPDASEDAVYDREGEWVRVRIYEWGDREGRYYQLTVETVRFTGEPPATRLQHILFDVNVFRTTPMASGVDRSADPEGAPDGE